MNKLENIIAKQLYYEIKNILISKKILAFNVRQFSNKIQQFIQQNQKIRYNDLSDEEKQNFQNKTNYYLGNIKNNIENITKNPQYQDWICKQIKNNILQVESFCDDDDNYFDDDDDNYIEYLKQLLNDYDIVKKYEEDKKFKNILFFNDYRELETYVKSAYQKYNKSVSLKNQKKNISKLFYKLNTFGKYDLYIISEEDKRDFQDIYGDNGYKCAWCVTKKGQSYWNQYIHSGNLYLLTYSNSSKPAALLYVPQGGITDQDSIQFKNIHNDQINIFDNDISEMLYKILELQYIEIDQNNIDAILNLQDKFQQKEKDDISNKLFMFLYQIPKIKSQRLYSKLSDVYDQMDKEDQLKLFKHWIQDQQGHGAQFINFLIQWDIIDNNNIDKQFQQLCLKHHYYRIFMDIVTYDGCNMSDEQQQRYINIYLTNSNCRNFITKRLSSEDQIYFNYENFKLLFQKAQNQQEQMKIIQSAYIIQDDEEKIAEFLAKTVVKKWVQQNNQILYYYDWDSYFGSMILKYTD